MSKENLYVDDINFVDAVFGIPENAVEVVLNVKSYENGELVKTVGTYDFKAVREAINLFEQTVEGEYPKYVATEAGKAWLEEQLAKEGAR